MNKSNSHPVLSDAILRACTPSAAQHSRHELALLTAKAPARDIAGVSRVALAEVHVGRLKDRAKPRP